MSETLKVACIQLNSGPDMQDNLDAAAELIRSAAAQGAQFIATPENTDQIRRKQADRLETSGDEHTHLAIPFFSDIAKTLHVELLIGSIGVKVSDTHLANRSILFGKDGEVKAAYDKIHMFDVTLSRNEFYKESSDIKPGKGAVLTDICGVKTGLSICYDLRFPYLYRHYGHKGVQILTVPAAFTVPTGKAHWEVLLRARAIENGAFVIAPAQGGEHEGGRKTYGHSLIIGPWGEILAEKKDDRPGTIYAELDLDEVEKARKAIPSLTHDKKIKL
jgi:predicted amidohydrolase